ALHPFEHCPAGMLVGYVEVFAEPFLFRDEADEALCHRVGITIEEPHPFQSPDASKLAEQSCDAVRHTQILAVSHRILRHEDDFANSLIRESLRLRDEIVSRGAGELAR